jgi:arginyl-tRNA synthetase
MEMKELLKLGIEEALDKAVKAGTLPAGDYPEVNLEIPPQKDFGDFATNFAMQSARIAHQAPKMIAQGSCRPDDILLVAEGRYCWSWIYQFFP